MWTNTTVADNIAKTPQGVADSDVVFFDEVKGEYPDTLGLVKKKSYSDGYNDYDGDDYAYSRELNRWYGFYDPWLYGHYYGFYSPFYSSYYGWYDPWYYPYYGGWYGYYNPWYYSYYGGWYDPWWYGGYHHWHGGGAKPIHRDNGGIGMGYSNRGHVNTGIGAAGGYANRGTNYSTGRGNVYNDIAKKNDNTTRRIVSSNRTVGSRQSNSNFNSSRSYTNTYRSQDHNSSAFSGSNRSFSGGGGFSGGGFSGGGSRGGGGFSGGGGHGGRR